MILRVRYVVQGGHTHCRVFMGTSEAALGKCGDLVFRNEEFTEVYQNLPGRRGPLQIEFRREEEGSRGEAGESLDRRSE